MRQQRRWGRRAAILAVLLSAPVLVLSAVTASAAPATRRPVAQGLYRGFTDPQAVIIEGYSATAMEPFISRDGRYLLFNTSNQSPDIAALQYATSVSPGIFAYQGPVAGTNDPSFLSGTPSMDDDGNLYFVSPRSYSQTLSTVYTGSFASGRVASVHLVPGLGVAAAGTVDFDVEVSPDGASLYVSVGQFNGAAAPQSAVLSIYDRTGSSFTLDPRSARILRAVNKRGMLTYAASISTDGLELFFTRANPAGGNPAIYRAVRRTSGQPFGHVQRLAAITGFAEAPSLSADGSTVYYHLLVGSQFDIESVTRPATS